MTWAACSPASSANSSPVPKPISSTRTPRICGSTLRRHAGQAPEIDGHVYLSLGEAASELALRPGDLVSAVVRSSAEYDLAAEVVRVIQPAYRPPQAVKLRVVS